MNKGTLFTLSGIVFGFGLALSTMTRPEVVLDFLTLQDLGLILVMFPAAIIAGIAFNTLKGKKTPNKKMTYSIRDYPYGKHVIPGGIFFGIGWGLSGICPGAAIASLGTGNYPILFGLVGMALGIVSWGYIKKKFPKSKLVKDNIA
jgi:hypothetical protein